MHGTIEPRHRAALPESPELTYPEVAERIRDRVSLLQGSGITFLKEGKQSFKNIKLCAVSHISCIKLDDRSKHSD